MTAPPNSWCMVPLGDACTRIRNGLSIKQNSKSGGLPISRIETIAQSMIDPIRVGFAGIEPNEKEDWLLSKGEILFSHINSLDHLGKCALYEGKPPKLVHGMNLLALQPYSEIIDDRFLLRVLRSDIFRRKMLRFVNQSVNQVSIAVGKLKSVEIPLPPLPEQRRIAAILDKADAIRRKRQEAIRLTEEFLRSAFLEMFGDPVTNPKGWEVKTLGEVLADIESGWSPKCETHPAARDEWGVLKLGSVTWCTYRPNESKALLPGVSCRPDIEVSKGDLLFTRKNTYELVGAAAYVFDTPPKLMLPDLIFRLKLDPLANVCAIYLWQALIQSSLQKEIRALASGTSGSMPNISKARLRTLQIPVPPLDIQNRFENIVHEHQTVVARLEEMGQKSDLLFDSLVHRAFRGELNTSDPNDEPVEDLLERIKAKREEADVARGKKKAVPATTSKPAQKPVPPSKRIRRRQRPT